MRHLAILLCLSVLASACVDVPAPFRHEEGAAGQLARPLVARAVVVRPVEYVEGGRELAEAVVAEFIAREIPARLREIGSPASAGTWEIEGMATAEKDAVGILWTIRAPDGASVDHFSLLRGAEAAAERRRVAQEVVALLMGPAAAPAEAVEPRARTRVAVAPLAAVPGDGGPALRAAMIAALEREGFLVSETGADYMVQGRVVVSPGRPGEEMVDVAWTLKRPDQTEIGTVDQQGAVPKGRLAQPWGSVARDIAEGGAQGLTEMLFKLEKAGTRP